MEYHVLKDVLFVNPWPELEGRQKYLLDARGYASGLTGVHSEEAFSQKFFDTVIVFIYILTPCSLKPSFLGIL